MTSHFHLYGGSPVLREEPKDRNVQKYVNVACIHPFHLIYHKTQNDSFQDIDH